ncbi:DUF4142 domain-containing protein [Sorangium sp. So ce1036]|uniref:DUF4142 domain-containing protein n=1 Tax=Sorangium sp. So ce1036 TaxID=3133328 RepID=UPI003F022633
MFNKVLFTAVALSAGLSISAALPDAAGQQRQEGQKAQPAQQGQRAQQGQQGQPSLAKADREFIEKASQGGLLEVRLGQLAQQHASTPEVKGFGQRMIDDHTTINKRLTELAERKGMLVPQELDKKHQEEVDKLAKKTGSEFDRDYMNMMVDDHKDDVERFEKASKDAKDADLKSFAAATLPTLREHLTQARQIQAKVKGKGK